MAELKSSKARLRTRLGCNRCRELRKKCNEQKPSCERCTRTRTACTWPTEKQLANDGRRGRGSLFRVTRRKSPPDPDFLPAWVRSLAACQREHLTEIANLHILSLEPTEETALFLHCFNDLLPSVLQHTATGRYSNFNYWRLLAADHPPLRDIAIACSAMAMSYERYPDSHAMMSMRQKAFTYQISAIDALRECIDSGSLDGSENWLLATVTCMTIFEDYDINAPPTSTIAHVKAMLQIFKHRETQLNQSGAFSPSEVNLYLCQALKMERICYETLLHQGAILTLHDSRCDVLVETSIWETMCNYFHNSPLPSDNKEQNWPILGVPYRLVQLAVEVSRLLHINPFSPSDYGVAESIYAELRHWIEETASEASDDPSIIRLYVVTARTLLDHILLIRKGSSISHESKDIQQCIRIILSMEAHVPLRRAHLWPLRALSLMSSNFEERHIIDERIRAISSYRSISIF